MAVSFNKVIIIGNLADDPDLRYTSNDKAVVNLSVAVNDNYKDDVDFFKVVAWNRVAENCDRYLSKGSPVLVEGKLKKNQYEYKGEKRYSTEIVAFNIQFLPSNRSGSRNRNIDQRKASSSSGGQTSNFNEDNNGPYNNYEQKKKKVKDEIGKVEDEFYEEEDDDIPF